MSNYVHITNGLVDDMIAADAEFISILDNASEWVDTTGLVVSIGYNYNGTSFYLPQPYPSWTLDAELKWVAPIQKPDDGQKYKWDESIQNWAISLTKSTANPVETSVNLDTTTA